MSETSEAAPLKRSRGFRAGLLRRNSEDLIIVITNHLG
jgi:hypothetical protein